MSGLIEKRSPQERLIIAKTLIESVLDDLPSAQPTQTNTPNALDSLDCVSRQAAIDAVGNMLRRKFGIGGDLAEITLTDLPSAQPEIVRCKDCKNWDTTWQNDWAKNYHYCPLIDGTRNGDWYCADAERRTNG